MNGEKIFSLKYYQVFVLFPFKNEFSHFTLENISENSRTFYPVLVSRKFESFRGGSGNEKFMLWEQCLFQTNPGFFNFLVHLRQVFSNSDTYMIHVIALFIYWSLLTCNSNLYHLKLLKEIRKKVIYFWKWLLSLRLQ